MNSSIVKARAQAYQIQQAAIYNSFMKLNNLAVLAHIKQNIEQVTCRESDESNFAE
jgi:hypothetical protein